MNMSKKLLAVLLAALMIFAAGCAGNSQTAAPETTAAQTESETTVAETTGETAPEETGMRTVVDATGNEVEVPVAPQSIVITGPVFPNIVFALQGHMNNVTAIPKSAYTGWQASLMKELAPELENVNTTIVSGNGINMEELASVKPDLVLCWNTATDTIEQLNGLNIPVAAFKASKNMESLESLIAMMGDVLNCQDRAQELLEWYHEVESYVDSKQDEITALSDEQKPRVLTFSTVADLSIYATGMDAWITEQVGGQNIVLEGASAERSAPTMEEILKYNPQIIFLSNWDDSTPDDLYENRIDGQDWSNVDAVINHHVYKVPISLYRWTPPNTVEKPLYYLYMASIIQPEIFHEIDMRQEESDFVQKYFGITLTEEQLDYVFHADLYTNKEAE